MKQRFIQELSPETIHLLQRIYQRSTRHQVRQRAHCILLSFDGYPVTELMVIFAVTRKTIYRWLEAWDQARLVGLYDRPGRGRKMTFNDEEQQQIRDWAKATPNNLNAVLAKIQGKMGCRGEQNDAQTYPEILFDDLAASQKDTGQTAQPRRV